MRSVHVRWTSAPHIALANAAARDQSGDTALHKLCTDVVPEQRRSARLETLRAMLTLGCPMEAKNHEVRIDGPDLIAIDT